MNSKTVEFAENIDLVYLWCDGDDPEFKRERNEAFEKYHNTKLDSEGCSDFRFIQMDELKYSLRSVEKYAPWIRNIYIVTYKQTPSWLNLDNPKIKIVDHSEIIPQKYLPTFNSTAIEVFLPQIKGLSEHFLFANDDMFFWGEVAPDFFFTNEGAPICRTSKRITKVPTKSLFGLMVYKGYKMVLDKFGKDVPYWSHHGIDSYRKTDYLECIEHFKDEFEQTASHQFRENTDVQRMIVTYYAVAEKGAVIKEYPRHWYDKFIPRINETCYASCTKKKMKLYRGKEFKLFCINDGPKAKPTDRIYMKELLEEKFPNKSCFEK